MDLYSLAVKLALEGLKALCVDGKTKATGPELLEWVKQNRKEEYPQIRPSWPSHLTRVSQEPVGPIIREPGSYGYLLRPAAPSPATTPTTTPEPASTPAAEATTATLPETPAPEETEETPKTPREHKLYQIFADWLDAAGYQAEDTSSARSGGRWGNPDVVGIRTAQTIEGNFIYEIASIEAKVTSKDWKTQFFEAVSHKRFADRVYFAFSYGAENPSVSEIEEFADLRAYAEKFRIGVVVVFFNVATHTKLVSGTREEVETLSLDEGRVEEIWPAVLDTSSPFLRDQFLRDVLGIDSLKALHAFGAKA